MESIDWMTVVPVGLAIAIFVGGMLMMFTGIWTSRKR
jgi:succinate-acetate transporter protein